MSDVTDLCALIAGTTVVFDCRYNVTVAGTDVTAWGDANGGSSTFTGHLTQASAGAIMSANGTTEGMGTSAADFNLANKHSLIYIGTVESGGSISTAMYDSTDDLYHRIGESSSKVAVSSDFAGAGVMITPSSTTPRLVLGSRNFQNAYGGGSLTPTAAEAAKWVQGRVGTDRMMYVTYNNTNRACKLYVAGLRPTFALSYPAHIQAIIVTDHPVTSTEWAAIKTWATTYHTWTSDDTVSLGAVYFDGNSLTSGLGTATPGHEYPTEVMAQSGMSGWDWVNLGVGARTGATQLVSIPWRVNPFFSGNQTAKVYVCWEIGNDIQVSGASAAVAAQHILDMCASATAAGATHCIAVTAGPRSDLTGANDTKRLAANALVLAAVGTNGITRVADVASISQLQNTADLTYFQADGIHYTDAGYALVATDATNGVYPTILAALTPPTGIVIAPFDHVGAAGVNTINTSVNTWVLNHLYLVTVYNFLGVGGPYLPTIAGMTQQATRLSVSDSRQRVTLFSFLGDGTTSAKTIDMSGALAQTYVEVVIDDVTGSVISGANGTDAFVQVVTGDGLEFSTPFAVTLAPFADASNATWFAAGNFTNAATPKSGYTALSSSHATALFLDSEYLASADTAPNLTNAGTAYWTGLGVELAVISDIGPPVAPPGFGITTDQGIFDVQLDTTVLPVGMALTVTRGTPAIQIIAGGIDITLNPIGFGLATSRGTPIAHADTLLAPSGLSMTASVGTPAISGPVTLVMPTGLSMTASVGRPSTTSTHLIVNPLGFGLTVFLGHPSLSGKTVQLNCLQTSGDQS